MGARKASQCLPAACMVVLVVHMLAGCGPPPQVRLQAEDRYQLALSYRYSGSYPLAEREIRKALELVPDDPRYLELLAIIYQDQRRLQPAEEAYRLALQQPQVPPSVLANYSTLLLLRERLDEAIVFARRALQDARYSKPALAYTNLGLAYLKKGALSQALEELRRALEYQPDLPEAHYNLGLVYTALGQHERAIRAFRDAIHYRPVYVEAHASLGRALLEAGRKDEARSAFERVIALAPESEMATASRKQLQSLTP